MTADDVDKLMAVMDSNKNGFIDYTEFIAGCLTSQTYLKENHLKAAFNYYDKDSSGTISIEELKQCLHSEELTLTDRQIEKLMNEVDTNKDGTVRIAHCIYRSTTTSSSP
jgi:calcium-dependent protein kinase